MEQQQANPWMPYVDNIRAPLGKKMKAAAIYGLNGSEWVKTDTFKATPAEVTKMVNIFENKEALSDVQTNGLFIEGRKYKFVKFDDNSVMCKTENETLALSKTKTGVVICLAESQGGMDNGAVCAITPVAQYLEGVGY